MRCGVNLLRPAAPGFISFSGDVTLARSSGMHREWRQLSVRRRAVMTASTIAHNTRWAAIQASGPETWRAVAEQISRYLSESQAAGLLAGDTPRRAFYVQCDQDTNRRSDGLSFVVGLALARPDEFVAFRFEHDVSDCRVTEMAWQPGTGLAS
jgi:phage tail sheath protein FI